MDVTSPLEAVRLPNLYGAAGVDLPIDTLRKLVERLTPSSYREPSSDQALQRVRWWVLRDRIGPAAKRKLEDQYKSDVARKGTAVHVTEAVNPASDIVHRICQVYRHGTRRHVVGLTKAKAKAFQTLYREAGIANLGPDWNRTAYYVGPTFVVPKVCGDVMRVDTVLPHRRAIVLDEENPTGWPVAVAYLATGGNVVVLERHRSTEWRLEGQELVKISGKGGPRSAHSYQGTPFPGLRFDAVLEHEDWDSATKHERLTDAAIGAAAVTAVMGFVRQTQNKVLLFLAGQLDKMAKGQNLADPEAPIAMETDQGRQVVLQAVKFDTPVTAFLEHIRFLYAAAAESTGVPAMISQDGAQIDLEFAYDGLSEMREEQIQYADSFEQELALALLAAAEDGKHPLWVAGKLPSPDEIRRAFRAEYGQMGRRFSDPKEQREQSDWEVRHGLISIADLLAKRYPNIDREELMAQIRKTLEENAELWDMIAARNGVTPDGSVTTAAQQNGAQGPAARDKGKVTNEA